MPIGSTTVDTDASGNASFSVVLPASLEPGSVVTSKTAELGVLRVPRRDGRASATDPGRHARLRRRRGGTPVTITGSGFLPGASVTIGGIPAANVVVDRFFHITATTPLLPPGDAPRRLRDRPEQHPARGSRWMADFLDVPAERHLPRQCRNCLPQGDHRGLRRRLLLPQQRRPARPDGRVPAKEQARPVVRAAGLHASRPLPRRRLPRALHRLDRAVRGRGQSPADAAEATTARATRFGATRWPSSCSRRSTGLVVRAGPLHTDSSATCPVLPSSPTGSRSSRRGHSPRDAAGGHYCPSSPSTRAQMASFLVKTFHLQ